MYKQDPVLNFNVSFRLCEKENVIYRCDSHDIDFDEPKTFLAHLTREHRSDIIDNETNKPKDIYKILRRLSHRIAKEFEK